MRNLKNIIRAFALGVGSVIVLASVLVHPSGSVKAVQSARPLLTGSDIDPAVLQVIQRSCQNCHSEKTEWPWYSYVAPMSWLVESDVAEARSHMDLSRWEEYTIEQKHEVLTRLGAMVRSGKMPPVRYTMIHAEAKLSTEEREQIYEWTRTERRKWRLETSVGSLK